MQDSDLLCEAGDSIDNAVFNAIQSFAYELNLDWDMSIIGEVSDFIETKLLEKGIPTCHPWEDDEEHICYSTNERCIWCKKPCTDIKE